MVDAFFFNSLVVAYVCTLPSEQRFKKDTLAAEKLSYFTERCTFEA